MILIESQATDLRENGDPLLFPGEWDRLIFSMGSGGD
jgi:hypothetical protein